MRYCDVGWYGVVALIRSLLMVWKIIGWDSDGTSEHGEWFEGGRRNVYKESIIGVGGFPFLLSLLVLLYSKASYVFETVPTLVLSWFPRNKYQASSLVFRYHIIVTNITYARPRPLEKHARSTRNAAEIIVKMSIALQASFSVWTAVGHTTPGDTNMWTTWWLLATR